MLVPGKGRTAQARLWAYVVDDRASGAATPALAWYRFTPDRSGIHPQSELGSFTGLLQADGYAGYDKLYQGSRKIGRASCRERVCQYVSISVVAVSLEKKKRTHEERARTSTRKNL